MQLLPHHYCQGYCAHVLGRLGAMKACKGILVLGKALVVANGFLFVWNGVEIFCEQHPVGDALGEADCLFSDVEEEGFGAPLSNQHDDVHWYTIQGQYLTQPNQRG